MVNPIKSILHVIKGAIVNFFPKNFPKRKLFPLLLMLFIEGLCTTILNSYIGYLMVDIGLAEDTSDAGNYSGWLIGSFSAAQFISSYIIGALSDVVGRRPMLLVGAFGVGCSNLMFGFTFNYYYMLFCSYIKWFT
ncbi:Major Facilitator Superfamily [Entamoeba marina]